MMLNRLNILLCALLVLCALALVTSQHKARKLFVEIERAKAKSKQLDVRWNELQVQQNQFAKTSLIDSKARRDMGMHSVPADQLVHLQQDSQPQQAQGTGALARLGEKPRPR